MSYLERELTPKEQTTKDVIAPGSIELRHLSPALFLELQLIKLHNHLGTNSAKLSRAATPNVIAGQAPLERMEHGTASWSGGAASSGSVTLTFGSTFKAVPTVVVTAEHTAATITVVVDSITTSQCVIRWSISSGTLTALDLNWLAVGR